jgi:hypothetical protein
MKGHAALVTALNASASPVRLRLTEPAECVRIQLFSESATATNQATELVRLIVREAPGLPTLTVLDHYPSIVAGGDFKRADREFCSHCAPSTFAKAIEQQRGSSLSSRSLAAQFNGFTSSRGDTHHDPRAYRKAATSRRLPLRGHILFETRLPLKYLQCPYYRFFRKMLADQGSPCLA